MAKWIWVYVSKKVVFFRHFVSPGSNSWPRDHALLSQSGAPPHVFVIPFHCGPPGLCQLFLAFCSHGQHYYYIPIFSSLLPKLDCISPSGLKLHLAMTCLGKWNMSVNDLCNQTLQPTVVRGGGEAQGSIQMPWNQNNLGFWGWKTAVWRIARKHRKLWVRAGFGAVCNHRMT